MTSKLFCTVVWGAALWGFLVLLFASSRLNINLQFTKDFDTKCYFGEDVAHPFQREAFDTLPKHIAGYANKIFVQQRSRDQSLENMCTMVMLTYKREKLLTFLLNHYCKVKSLHKIIVIWNEVHRKVPSEVLKLREDCLVDLLFIQAKVNKLTNRFRPRPEIETDCVCIIDDDRFIIDLRDLEFGFNVWQNFRHRIIGFEHRTHFQLHNGSLWYDLTDFSKARTNYSMILTSTAILHKAYLDMFFDNNFLPQEMIDYIDERKNCEDIALNAMVGKFLQDSGRRQPAALAVKPKREVRNLDHSKSSGLYKGLSSLPDHYVERSRCLNDLKEMYGGVLSLPYATFIMENMAWTPRRYATHHNTSKVVLHSNSTYLMWYRQRHANSSYFNLHKPYNITKSSDKLKSLVVRRNNTALYPQRVKPSNKTLASRFAARNQPNATRLQRGYRKNHSQESLT